VPDISMLEIATALDNSIDNAYLKAVMSGNATLMPNLHWIFDTTACNQWGPIINVEISL
jgi:hypothetical protein